MILWPESQKIAAQCLHINRNVGTRLRGVHQDDGSGAVRRAQISAAGLMRPRTWKHG